MAFSEQFLEELRARTGLADVISRRVKLTKKGREHLGLCPFHKEKTPSFTVNEEKGFGAIKTGAESPYFTLLGVGKGALVIKVIIKEPTDAERGSQDSRSLTMALALEKSITPA